MLELGLFEVEFLFGVIMPLTLMLVATAVAPQSWEDNICAAFAKMGRRDATAVAAALAAGAALSYMFINISWANSVIGFAGVVLAAFAGNMALAIVLGENSLYADAAIAAAASATSISAAYELFKLKADVYSLAIAIVAAALTAIIVGSVAYTLLSTCASQQGGPHE